MQTINYTNCNDTSQPASQPVKECAESIKPNEFSTCPCEVKFNLTENWDGDVYFYYALSNFYQNHRRYVRSRNDEQLLGSFDSFTDCE